MNGSHELMLAGEFADALRELRKTPAAARDHNYYYSEGCILLALGDYKACLDSFDRAEETAPKRLKNALTAEVRAIALFLEGRVEAAIDGLERHAADFDAGRVPYSSDSFGLGPKMLLVSLLALGGRKRQAQDRIASLLDSKRVSDAWPVPIAQFLQGGISSKQLIHRATDRGEFELSREAENQF